MEKVTYNQITSNKQNFKDEFRKNNSYVDMHVHSIYSDGELTPNECLKKALENKVGTIAITDHDTLLGNKNILYGKDYEESKMLKIISGIELTAKVEKGRMHILGYDFNLDDNNLNSKMKDLRNNSLYSILGIVSQLKKDHNIMFDYDDIKDIINKKGNIGRPHIGKLLIKYGFVDNVEEAFDKYLIEAYAKARYSNKGLPEEECINLIKNAGGLTVLAHPNQLKVDDYKLEEILKKLIYYGLDGIEVYHSKHTKEEVNKYLYLAEKYNLLISGGSDYHGAGSKPDIELGRGIKNNVRIKKLSLLDKIK